MTHESVPRQIIVYGGMLSIKLLLKGDLADLPLAGCWWDKQSWYAPAVRSLYLCPATAACVLCNDAITASRLKEAAFWRGGYFT
jgi:hypothetical protein